MTAIVWLLFSGTIIRIALLAIAAAVVATMLGYDPLLLAEEWILEEIASF